MTGDYEKKLSEIVAEFQVDHNDLIRTRDRFYAAMQYSGSLQPISVPGNPYELPPPDGSESGFAIGLDMGGSSLRTALFEFQEPLGRYRCIKSLSIPLRGSAGGLNYLSKDSSATDLFGLQANLLGKLASICDPGNFPLPLGYVFSYPIIQAKASEAVLVHWTKEIATPGVEGRNVAALLKDALEGEHLSEAISYQVTMNDTVGTLMASSYCNPATVIASVIGTGYNSCYLNLNGPPRIINLECGNFSEIDGNWYDRVLDLNSSCPGRQKLEKMVSGQYLGELYRLACLDLFSNKELPPGSDLLSQYGIDSRVLSMVLNDGPEIQASPDAWAAGNVQITPDPAVRRVLRVIAGQLVKRSARLIAATQVAILSCIPWSGQPMPVIAIEGGLYSKMPGYAVWHQQALIELGKVPGCDVMLQVVQEGPSMGAAASALRVFNRSR